MCHHKYNISILSIHFPGTHFFFIKFIQKENNTKLISAFFNQNSQVWTDLDHKTFSILPSHSASVTPLYN